MTDTTTPDPGTDVATNGDDHDTGDEGTLEVFPPAREPSLAALGTLGEHVAAMRQAVWFAEGMCYTEMVPARFRGKPKDAAAAILFGAEVGLTPVASLRSVIVIHGQPGFEARTMKAILKAHGYRFRTIEKGDTRAEIECTSPDGSEVERASWTIEDAVRAGYVPQQDGRGAWITNTNGKLKGNMKYIETPKVMLDAKVTAEVCRSIAPHLLLGLPYSSEELETEYDTEPDGGDDAPPRDRRAKGVARLRDRAKAAKHKDEPQVILDAETTDELVTETTMPVDDAPDPADVEAAIDRGDVDAVTHDTPPPTPAPDVAPEPVPDATPDPEPQPAPDVAPEPAPVVEPEPSGAGMAADKGGDRPAANGTPPPASAPEDDVAMSPAVRSKGEDMLAGLLINGGVSDEYRADVLSEVANKRPRAGAEYRRIESVADTTNVELKFLVDTLRAWKAKGNLEAWCNDAVNNAALREAGMLDADEAQSS